jgi:Cys-tRNA(Pro)/Cys-tRNA(Cys) deacylase
MAKKPAAGTPATAVLTQEHVEHTLHPYDVAPDAPNYGALVAQALGIEPARVFKTLIAEVDGRLVVAVVPVTGDLDLKALAGAAGGKRAALADRAAAERSSGYVRGGSARWGSAGGCRRWSTRPRSTSTGCTSRRAAAASRWRSRRPTWFG